MSNSQIFSTVCALGLLTGILCSASHAQKKELLLPVHSDQAVGALIPSTGPLDLDAKPENADLLNQVRVPSRGPGMKIFPKLAPSIVVVRTNGGYGTGFIVDQDGWILTNEHVIANGSIDLNSGSRYAFIHFGDLNEGVMTLEKKSYPALVYASSTSKDLALLKLFELPEKRELKPIQIAESNAMPGSDCITIGHPSRGLFWSVRSGEVVGTGRYPHDLIDTVMPQFSMSVDAQKSYKQSLNEAESRKSLISTCGINPGDSGGPLVNKQGELIAVNFAIPLIDSESQVNYDKFSYHVHLDEVKDFIKSKPEKSEVYRPDYWPPATFSTLTDRDEDDIYESWVFSIKDEEANTGVLFDLDNDTPSSFADDFVAGNANRDEFDFEVAVVVKPVARWHYDRDNDGEIDLIMTDIDDNGVSDLTVAKKNGVWKKLETKEMSVLDTDLFQDENIQRRYRKIVLNLEEKAETPPDKKPRRPSKGNSSIGGQLKVD